MDHPYSGGCVCGGLRYEASSPPVAESHCQCRECRMRSGTGHGSYLVFAPRSAVAIAGAAREWRVAGDSGAEKAHGFCPVCGGPVYVTFDAAPDIVAIHAGSLDQPSRFRPTFVTYAVRAETWDALDPALRHFDRMPDAPS